MKEIDRRGYLGGSDAAAALGLSPWRTQLELYLIKRGELEPEDISGKPWIEWGNLLEAPILQKYADETGHAVTPHPPLLRHPEHPWIVGSLDGIIPDNRVVEIKTARDSRKWGEPGTDEVPITYALQVQQYMMLSGLPVADIAVLFGGSDFQIYTIEADPETQALMLDGLREFWRRVQDGDPPDPMSVADAQLRFPCATMKETDADAAAVDAHRRLGKVRAALKKLKAQEDALKLQLQAAIGEYEALSLDGRLLATWKNSKPRVTFDSIRFRADDPAAYAKYTKTGAPVRRFLYKEVK